MSIAVKRAYDRPAKSDGTRVLVDRVWPRGVTKDQAGIDLWLKEIAPSAELRQWFAHDPAKWLTFKSRYFKELQGNKEAVAQLTALIRKDKVTLIYGAKNQDCNNAVALREYLQRETRTTTR